MYRYAGRDGEGARRRAPCPRAAGAVVALSLWIGLPLAPPAHPSAFGETLAATFEALAVPGLAYAVVEDGALVESGGLGVADVRTGEPVTARTPFRVASLTKPLAAALLVRAAENGAGDLERPLHEASSRFRTACRPMKAYFERHALPYLEGIGCDDERLRVRHVMTHTAATPPGSRYAYDGFLFGLLDEAIGDALGNGGTKGFVRAVRGEIIAPLALEDTAAGITDGAAADVVARLAAPHVARGAEWHAGPLLSDPLNAGAGLIASAGDMATIDIAYRERLAGDEVYGRLTAPTVLADGSRSPYAMGWFVQVFDGREVHWHHGHQPGAYSGLWVRDVERGRTLIALANADGLAAGLALHEGDVTASPLARAFLRLPWRSEADETPRRQRERPR